MKRKLSVLLLLAALLTNATACQSGEDTPAQTTETTAVPPETETVETELTDSLPEKDMEGYVFKIFNCNDGGTSEMHVEEANGDIINDAIYARDIVIEERFNMNFENMYYGAVTELWGAATKQMGNDILAGSTEYAVMRMRIPNSVEFFTDGYIYTYEDIPHLDLDMPWWNQGVKESLTIADHVLFTYGDYNLTSYDSTNLILFNKAMITDFDFPSPYELVKNGTWTLDTMLDMMKTATADINGDGTLDNSDCFGMYNQNAGAMSISLYMAAGERLVTMDDNGMPTFQAGANERIANIYADALEIMWESDTVFTNGLSKYKGTDDLFVEGRALFRTAQAAILATLRDVEFDFGVIPYPKYDDTQEKYYTRHEGCYPIMVPITNTNIENTGILMEAMAFYSHQTLIPVYCDMALQSKYARDSESAEMLDIIFAGRIVDMGDIFFTETVRKPFQSMVDSGKNTFASTVAAMQTKADDNINEVTSAFVSHFHN